MEIKTTAALIGGAFGLLITGAMYYFGPLWLPLAVGSGIVLIAYIIARFTAGTDHGEFMRGLMVGINSMLGFALANLIYASLFGSSTAGLAIGGVLALLTFLTVIGPISNSGFYQGVMGYLNWFLPMSWLIVVLGFLFFLVSLIGGLFLGLIARVDFFKLEKLAMDWKTGTIFIKGGFVSNLNPIDTAFNMGNFSFVDTKSSQMHIDHEAGHTLNLAAFGSLFHLIGALDENVLGGHDKAFSERLAESNVPSSSRPVLKMWI